MIQTVEAVVDVGGRVRLLGEVHVSGPHRALVTVLDEPAVVAGEPALPAEAARDRRETSSAERQADIAARREALARIGSYDTRVRAGLSPLSNEDVSRESIYEGRGQ